MRFCFVTIFVFFIAGCVTKFVAVKKPENIAEYLAKIDAYNRQIEQVKASLDIKAHGVMAGFFHEQADIVVRSPHFMYWSVRSFFGPPSIMVASNGEYLTAFDFSGQSPSTYLKLALHEDTFFELMEFRLHPASIIPLFLRKIPLEHAQNISFSVWGDQLAIEADLNGGWHMRSIFDVAQDRLLETEIKNKALSIMYRARYADYVDIGGIYFPSSLVLFAQGKSRSAKLNVEFLHTELNGELVLPDVFYLKPH